MHFHVCMGSSEEPYVATPTLTSTISCACFRAVSTFARDSSSSSIFASCSCREKPSSGSSDARSRHWPVRVYQVLTCRCCWSMPSALVLVWSWLSSSEILNSLCIHTFWNKVQVSCWRLAAPTIGGTSCGKGWEPYTPTETVHERARAVSLYSYIVTMTTIFY